MNLEIETKILDVNIPLIAEKLSSLGAEKIQETRLIVDWYGPTGLTHKGDDPWYLRVRTTSDGKVELSWKSLAEHVGNTRQSKEINFNVDDSEKMGEFLQKLGLENYAHQEKDRISFTLQDWNFDLDKYPGMPAYLEVEGTSENHVAEAISLLGLESHTALSEGERKLISEQYGLDWNNMRF
jgi:adenylate cyclase class 2